MKYQKILGLVATAGLFLAGCATDTDTQNAWFNDSNAVRISASVGNATTRSNPTATDDAGLTSFNSGDKIGISNSGSSLTYTFDGDNWTPGNSEYLVWDTKNLTFQCWYPADGKNSFEYGYIQEDQSDADKIVKSDYMAAETTPKTIPSDKVLTVKLERKTARLIFKIQRFNDQFTASAKINNLSIVSKATTDVSETATVNITPLHTGEGAIGSTYTALVAPGSIEANIKVSDGGTISDPLVVKTGGLVAGKSYTYNLIVGKKAVTIADVKVADWQSANISEKQETAEEIPPYVTFTADKWHDFYLIGENGYVHSGLEYSVNFGEWKKYTSSSVTFGGKYGNLRLRGTNENGTAENATKYARISITQPGNGNVKCTGDIRTLLNYKNYKNVNTSNARFCYLFKKCDVLTSVPDLPATNLADNCYLHMFEECTSIAEAPKLPAKIMADHCYDYMFRKCTSIEKAPDLPATKLATRCYYGMFSGCTALTEVPDLLVKDLPEGCYQSMFSTCEALVNGPKVSAETIKQYSCYQMFAYCYNLSSVKLLIPSNQMKVSYGVYSCFSDAGTKASTRTLTVKDKAAYDVMIKHYSYPDLWKIGQCTVLDESGNKITE